MMDDRNDNPVAARHRDPVRMGAFEYPRYPFVMAPEQRGAPPRRYPAVVVGGGLVGLTAAVDLALKGIDCVLFDDNNTVSAGSRSIAQARRTMDIWARLGCAEPMKRKGISWSRGHTHFGNDCVLSFQVFSEGETRFPSFTSLAQYYVEHFLVERAGELANLDLRWLSKVVAVELIDGGAAARLTVETPEGSYTVEADWVVAADGARSGVRDALGLQFAGDPMWDKFVIADVKIDDAGYPNERNYWFYPPFIEAYTALRVPEPDSIWRIDWQIPADSDDAVELAPERVRARLERMLGRTDFQVEWVSTYTSIHRLMANFRHGPVLFAGDAAHQFSPFGGGRGGNSGVQDADNLVWKLAAVIAGKAGEPLLDSYNVERRAIAERNIFDSRRATEFIAPKSIYSRALQEAVLHLARDHGFARAYVNTGRFAVWPILERSTGLMPDDDGFAAADARPGSPALDCRLATADGDPVWFTSLVGNEFAVVVYGDPAAAPGLAGGELAALSRDLFPVRMLRIADAPGADALLDRDGAFARNYDAKPGTTYLFRPDQHVVARWRTCDAARVAAAMRVALHRKEEETR